MHKLNQNHKSNKYLDKLIEKDKSYWLYGINAGIAALRNKERQCLEILCTKNVLQKYKKELENYSNNKNLKLNESSLEKINSIVGKETIHQGLAIKLKPLINSDIKKIIDKEVNSKKMIVALDQVKDPRNVGAIIRSAAALGCIGIMMTDRNSPNETGVMAKSASGALEIIPISRVKNLSRELEKLKKSGFWVLGLSTFGENLSDIKYFDQPIVLVIGSESEGLRELTKKNCDNLINIPISKTSKKLGLDSLNAASAASIAIYSVLFNQKS